MVQLELETRIKQKIQRLEKRLHEIPDSKDPLIIINKIKLKNVLENFKYFSQKISTERKFFEALMRDINYNKEDYLQSFIDEIDEENTKIDLLLNVINDVSRLQQLSNRSKLAGKIINECKEYLNLLEKNTSDFCKIATLNEIIFIFKKNKDSLSHESFKELTSPYFQKRINELDISQNLSMFIAGNDPSFAVYKNKSKKSK